MPIMPAQLILRSVLCAAALAATPYSHAEKADRNKPVNLEADRVTGGGGGGGGQDAEGFKSGIATANPGNLARFRIKREGKDEYVEGEGERIEHDARNEVTKFFNRAYVKSGLDEVRGQYIVFDGPNENYSVTSGPAGSVVPGRDNRVRAVIQPKSKPAAEEVPAGQPPVRLQIAPAMTSPK